MHTLLSVSVLAPDCISADGYATAFMVMGFERAKVFLQNHQELQAYFIYSGNNGELQNYGTEGFEKIIKEHY
jgi:thiamine biosynthesis lipoprotein